MISKTADRPKRRDKKILGDNPAAALPLPRKYPRRKKDTKNRDQRGENALI